VERFGELMRISHDGDRVSRTDSEGTVQRGDDRVTDAYLRERIADLESEDPERVRRSQLWALPGGYGCSTPEIDRMVDIACGVPGVLGAQLSGAGLGGCILVLVREEAADALKRALQRGYYTPVGLRTAVGESRPVEGSGILKFDGSGR
jgi:N-acetylgalactosamine kinase